MGIVRWGVIVFLASLPMISCIMVNALVYVLTEPTKLIVPVSPVPRNASSVQLKIVMKFCARNVQLVFI